MSYNQITQEERYQTYALLKASNNQTQIAMILNRHKSAISRVIQRNTGLRGYRPQHTQRLADQRKDGKVCSRIGDKAWATVIHLTRQDQITAKNLLNIKRLLRLTTPIFTLHIHMLLGSVA